LPPNVTFYSENAPNLIPGVCPFVPLSVCVLHGVWHLLLELLQSQFYASYSAVAIDDMRPSLQLSLSHDIWHHGTITDGLSRGNNR